MAPSGGWSGVKRASPLTLPRSPSSVRGSWLGPAHASQRSQSKASRSCNVRPRAALRTALAKALRTSTWMPALSSSSCASSARGAACAPAPMSMARATGTGQPAAKASSSRIALHAVGTLAFETCSRAQRPHDSRRAARSASLLSRACEKLSRRAASSWACTSRNCPRHMESTSSADSCTQALQMASAGTHESVGRTRRSDGSTGLPALRLEAQASDVHHVVLSFKSTWDEPDRPLAARIVKTTPSQSSNARTRCLRRATGPPSPPASISPPSAARGPSGRKLAPSPGAAGGTAPPSAERE
mmetsp:Transcript_17113/g.49620  ORF Transcript_17113/g.49620 Transcript_17113/m.49620 type:complete len:301 (+) Transcript_17113:346-1248(+)